MDIDRDSFIYTISDYLAKIGMESMISYPEPLGLLSVYSSPIQIRMVTE